MKPREDACPRCASRRIVLGEIAPGRTIGPAAAFSFRAFASSLTRLRRGARVSPNMAACARCGLVWGEVSVNGLLSPLETFPTDEVSAWLQSRNDTPL